MKYHLLTTSWQRSMGAMFKKLLNDTVLVFVYPHPAPRLFHTFFCPPLRILALSEVGEILFDQVIIRHQFVRLPATRLILETAPGIVLSPDDLNTLARNLTSRMPPSLSTGAIDQEVAFHKLIFALVADALLNLRRLRIRCGMQSADELTLEGLRAAFAPEERGQLVNSAAFLLAYPDLWSLPPGATQLSRALIQVESSSGYLEELLAASVSANAWKRDFSQPCIRCAQCTGNWQPVLSSPGTLPPEESWRYTRPENHVFICRKCAYKIGWRRKEGVRHALALGMWGARFEAFQRWHKAVMEGTIPAEWDKEHFPLWPQAFGGDTWETGSGAFPYADPRPPEDVFRTAEHLASMKQALGRPRSGRLHDSPARKGVSLDTSLVLTGEAP